MGLRRADQADAAIPPVFRDPTRGDGSSDPSSNQTPTPRPAAAWDRARADDGVVVGQLFAALDRPGGADPDRLVDNLKPAVGRAGMVDEARDVAADVRVAAPRAVDVEDP